MLLGLIGGYFFIFFARVADVSLGVLRTLMLVKGKRFHAAFLGFFEVIIFILALDRVVGDLGNPISLLFYGLGFATGNVVGSYLEEKLALGHLTVQVISMTKPLELELIAMSANTVKAMVRSRHKITLPQIHTDQCMFDGCG